MSVLVVSLAGGPHDGLVAGAYGGTPLILVGPPRLETLLDDPVADADWNDACQWYEIRSRR